MQNILTIATLLLNTLYLSGCTLIIGEPFETRSLEDTINAPSFDGAGGSNSVEYSSSTSSTSCASSSVSSSSASSSASSTGSGPQLPNECNTNEDCAEWNTNFCLNYHCINHTCIERWKPNYTPVPDEIRGDCKKYLCINGQELVTNDDSDIILDDNVCTDQICRSGVLHESNNTNSCIAESGDSGTCHNSVCVGPVVKCQIPNGNFTQIKACPDISGDGTIFYGTSPHGFRCDQNNLNFSGPTCIPGSSCTFTRFRGSSVVGVCVP